MRDAYNERRLRDCSSSGGASLTTSASSGSDESDGEPETIRALAADTHFNCQVSNKLFSLAILHFDFKELIGVANVFLEVLFHPLRLDYQVDGGRRAQNEQALFFSVQSSLNKAKYAANFTLSSIECPSLMRSRFVKPPISLDARSFAGLQSKVG